MLIILPAATKIWEDEYHNPCENLEGDIK